MQLPAIKARLPRLEGLFAELGEDYHRWSAEGDLLEPLELHQYLAGLHQAMGGVDEARAVLGKVVNRVEELRLPRGLV